MDLKHPKVSVLLPVYNGSRYLREAVESILAQSFADFELILINDGSTDDTGAICTSFDDPRIRYFEQENIGLASTLNRAAGLARGVYLARQDSDDVSCPARFAGQVAFLDANPDCGMVGSWAEIWKEGERTPRAHRHPAEDAVLQFELLFNNPFVHSSVMMRRDVFSSVGPYAAERSRQPEDYELWSRISRRYRVANIPEFLQVYRETEGSICRENWLRLMDVVVTLSAENIAWRTGLSRDDIHVVNLAAIANVVFERVSAKPDLAEMRRIFLRAVDEIRRSSPGAGAAFDRAVRLRWRSIRFNYSQRFLRPGLFRVLGRLGWIR